MSRRISLLLVIGFLSSNVAHAKTDEEIVQEAVQATQTQMRDPSQRTEVLKAGGSRAKDADQNLNKLTGSKATTDEVYSLSADVLGPLMEKAHNNPEEAARLLQESASDPEGFAKAMTPEQQAKLKGIADKIEGSGRGPTNSRP